MRIRKKQTVSLLLFSLTSGLLIPGCRQNSGSDDVQVRLINAVPDAGALDVSVDGQRAWKGASFRSSTGYQGIAEGTYGVRVSAASVGGELSNRPIVFEKGHAYTVLVLGMVRDVGTPTQVQVLADDAPASVTGGKAGLRLVNAVPGTPALDLVVNNIVGLENARYGRRSGVLLLDGGSYDLKVVEAGTPYPLIGPISLRLEPGRTYTLVAMGQAANQTLSLEAYPDAR